MAGFKHPRVTLLSPQSLEASAFKRQGGHYFNLTSPNLRDLFSDFSPKAT